MMNNKEVKFGQVARSAMREGIDILADAVGSTLGPNGNLVVIGKYSNGKPHVTKDGVTVAKNISFTDEYKEAGAQLIKEAALKQLVVGDGTTTTTVLAQEMIHVIDTLLEEGKTPMSIKKDMREDVRKVCNYIETHASHINTIDDLEKIATISANNDAEIGKLIADAFRIISKDGVITVDESSNLDTTIETITGMQFNNGYVSPYFCTDIVKNIAVLEKPYILITDQKINRIKDIIDIVEHVYAEGRSLLMIAEDFDSEVVNNLAVNMQHGLKVCCVKCPSFGDYRVPVLMDIATLVGGKVATYENTIEPKDITIDMLGTVDKVIVTKTDTTLIGSSGDPKEISDRVESIKQQLSIVNSDPQHAEFLTDYYEKRIARLAGGVAVIHVGGATELERGERKDRVDDAIAATKAAIESGIVAGGGVTYYNIYKTTDIQSPVIAEALTKPIKMLLNGCNKTLETFEESRTIGTEGFDAKTGVFVKDMISSGIIDPAKTVTMAFVNACSVAELYLMTNCIVVPEKIE